MDREALLHFVAGAVGGTTAAALTCPLDVVKTNLQSSNFYSSYGTFEVTKVGPRVGIFKCAREIVARGGMLALYKGVLPIVCGIAPSRAVYFYTYSTSKRFCNDVDFFKPNSTGVFVVSATIAGFVTAIVTNPIWLVKTRIQLHPGEMTVRSCIRSVYERHGWTGFFKGVTASYMGISDAIVQFVMYENLRKSIEATPWIQDKTKFVSFMLAGGVSKFVACITTYPHEVVRTRMYEESSKSKHFFRTLWTVYKDAGVRGLYSGVSLQLLRAVPNTAITMGMYEVLLYLGHKAID